MSELFIDGQWCEAGGPPFLSRNPGTGAVVWEGKSASALAQSGLERPSSPVMSAASAMGVLLQSSPVTRRVMLMCPVSSPHPAGALPG